MAISVLIRISGDTATPALTALRGAVSDKWIAGNIGEALVTLFQRHFANVGQNKQGWPSTGFWPAAARATNWQAVTGGVVINVNQIGVRQRLMGGDIFPTDGHQYLTIPARPEAYGKRAGEFNNLKVAYSRRGAYALVEADAIKMNFGKSRKRAGHRDFSTETVGGGVFFWLVKSVHQKPDPTVIPDERDIQGVAEETLAALIERVANEGTQS